MRVVCKIISFWDAAAVAVSIFTCRWRSKPSSSDHHRELWSVAAATNIHNRHAHYQINFAGGASMVYTFASSSGRYSCTARSAVPVRKLVAGVDMNMHAARRLLLA
jgi:hypothetical protein